MGCTSFSKSSYSSVLFCQGCNVKPNTIVPSCKRVYLGCHHKKARIIWREGNETLIMLQRSTSVLHNTCMYCITIYSTTFAIANCVHSHCRFFSEIFGRQRAWKSTSTWCCGVSWFHHYHHSLVAVVTRMDLFLNTIAKMFEMMTHCANSQ